MRIGRTDSRQGLSSLSEGGYTIDGLVTSNYNVITMKTKLVKIGNSQGVRIPRALLNESGLNGEVELVVDGNAIVVRPACKPREGWGEAFAKMAKRGDDELLMDEPKGVWSTFDEEEWEW